MASKPTRSKFAVALLAAATFVAPLRPQDLTPRAYIITPTGSHSVIVSSSFNTGGVDLDPSLPIQDSNGKFQASALSYYQSFGLLGRSTNFSVSVPYAVADLSATLNGDRVEAYRSGLADTRIRLSTNLNGGPAMNIEEYASWQEKRLIGASLTVTVPASQYDPGRVINIGTHRWGFKPELGVTRRWRHWVLDAYGGVWFFTPNDRFSPGTSTRTQAPLGAVEAHLGSYVTRRLWMSATTPTF